MIPYRFTPRARADLSNIWDYIAIGSELAADRVADKLKLACAFVGTHPHAGHSRSDLTSKAIFFWKTPRLPYMILYNPHTSPVRIIRILHGARDIPQAI